MIEIEAQVRVAIRDALNRKSRKPFYWGGLKGYEQLEAIAKALEEVAYDEPRADYLQRLKRRVDRVVETYRVNAEDLREAHTWLRRIADCLRYPSSDFASGPALTGEQVKREMAELLQSFQPDLKRKPACPRVRAGGRRQLSMGPGAASGRTMVLICYIATTFLVYLQTTCC